jgi:hypothetical protein
MTEANGLRASAAFAVLCLAFVVGAGAADPAPHRGAMSSIRLDCADAHYGDVRFDRDDDAVRGAPEILYLLVCNDVQGELLLRVLSTNRVGLGAGDTVEVFMDADRSSSTGAPSKDGVPAGADFLLYGDARSAAPRFGLDRWQGSWVPVPTPSLVVNNESPGLTFRLPSSALATTSFFVSALTTFTSSAGRRGTDTVPDDERWLYPIITTGEATGPPPLIPPPRPPAPPDTEAPSVRPSPVSARRGTLVRLRYRVVDRVPDPRGAIRQDPDAPTRELVTVRRGSRVIWSRRTPMRPGGLRTVAWRAQRSPTKALQFCVQAWDRRGNRSGSTCARIRLR